MVAKIPLKSSYEIDKIRDACQVTSQVLDEVTDIIEVGISTDDINTFVHDKITELGGVPATLNYKGYPKSVCTSLNEIVCHGIPNPHVKLVSGDIINVDVTSIVEGYFGDSSRMYYVGSREACSIQAIELVEATYLALCEAIKVCKPSARFGDIGATIQDVVNHVNKGYGIVREYTGHGIGRDFHEPPQVLHVGKRGLGELMKTGMVFTIEPMINLGTAKTILSPIDGWTVRTADGGLSAQWEHTIAITQEGFEVLTLSKRRNEVITLSGAV
jgi:methionyl aminopeptidase